MRKNTGKKIMVFGDIEDFEILLKCALRYNKDFTFESNIIIIIL